MRSLLIYRKFKHICNRIHFLKSCRFRCKCVSISRLTFSGKCLHKILNKRLRAYMTNYLAIMMTVSSIIAIRSKDSENLEKKKELWQYLKEKDAKLYVKIRYGILGQTMNLPGKPGRKVSSLAYTVANRIFGFN